MSSRSALLLHELIMTLDCAREVVYIIALARALMDMIGR